MFPKLRKPILEWFIAIRDHICSLKQSDVHLEWSEQVRQPVGSCPVRDGLLTSVCRVCRYAAKRIGGGWQVQGHLLSLRC